MDKPTWIERVLARERVPDAEMQHFRRTIREFRKSTELMEWLDEEVVAVWEELTDLNMGQAEISRAVAFVKNPMSALLRSRQGFKIRQPFDPELLQPGDKVESRLAHEKILYLEALTTVRERLRDLSPEAREYATEWLCDGALLERLGRNSSHEWQKEAQSIEQTKRARMGGRRESEATRLIVRALRSGCDSEKAIREYFQESSQCKNTREGWEFADGSAIKWTSLSTLISRIKKRKGILI